MVKASCRLFSFPYCTLFWWYLSFASSGKWSHFVFPVLTISSVPPWCPPEAQLCFPCLPWHWGTLQAGAQPRPGGEFSASFTPIPILHLPPHPSPALFAKYCSQGEWKDFSLLQGLKSVDSSVKKEGDLPAADPSTPIPLKYEDESTSGGPESLEKQMALFLDKSKLYCCANKTFPVPTQTAATLFWLSKQFA